MDTFKIRVDIWSDFSCPFCYIGKRRLEQALSKFEHKDKVEKVFRSFQLDPHFDNDSKATGYVYLIEKCGMKPEKAKSKGARMVQAGKEVGLEFNFETMIMANTYDAHRVAHFAQEKGKGEQVVEHIMRAQFIDSKDIEKREVLIKIAIEEGLDEKETKSVLLEGRYSEEINKDIMQAAKRSIHGVPLFLFNNKYEISGAQPEEEFVQVLEKAWNEANQGSGEEKPIKKDNLTPAGGHLCEDRVCRI